MRLFFSMFIAYLVGSIPTGYLFAKYTKNIDLRDYGSGNVGATNVLRAVGKVAAFFTLVLDILKGYVTVTFLADMLYNYRMEIIYPQYQAILAVCAVAGHNWPIFLSFKGGKGLATSAGILLALCPKILLIGLFVWVFVFTFTKIVSVASLLSAIAIAMAGYFFPYNRSLRILIILLAVLTVFRHKANIRRIIKREEKKVVVKI